MAHTFSVTEVDASRDLMGPATLHENLDRILVHEQLPRRRGRRVRVSLPAGLVA